MRWQPILLASLPLVSGSPAAVPRSAPAFAFPGDPSYGVDPNTLAAALTCPNGPAKAGDKPVLLVHGTGSTGSESFGKGYVPGMNNSGYTPCYVDLPARAMGDMQVSSAYIAYNLHNMYAMFANTPVGVIGHSQGNPDIQWALHFFPSTQKVTSMYVGLSPVFTGITDGVGAIHDACALGALLGPVEPCTAALWQLANGSHYYGALDARGQVAQVPTTALWTLTDGLVNPPGPNAQLAGATVYSVQDLCPARVVNHLQMLIDAAAFALAIDAFEHGGHADLDRVRQSNPGVCAQVTAPQMSVTLPWFVNSTALDALTLVAAPNKIDAEPPVMQYAVDANES